jgi:ferredoxin/flavodoxin
MVNRRTFLGKTAVAAMALHTSVLSGCIPIGTIQGKAPMKSKEVKTAAVLWYSQTGYTRRNGKLLARTLQNRGVSVTSSDIRDFDNRNIGGTDLIVVGSPVFYYDTPDCVKTWIKSLPKLEGAAVASYVTFGGPEGNQHNAACAILGLLTEKEGAPVGIQAFMNMSSFPLSWSEKHVDKKTWMSRHLPDENTFNQVRQYAATLVDRVKRGETVQYSRKLTLRECVTFLGPIRWTKKFVKNHAIDPDACIECGTCVNKCPVGAIDLSRYAIDRDACVLCFGCINNCPVQAVLMEYGGDKVFGYNEFLKRYDIKVMEPEETAG